MSRVKVLHVIDTLSMGGAQTLLRDFFEKQKDNQDIFIFPLRKKEPIVRIDHANSLHQANSSKYSLYPLFQLKKIIETKEITVLHCHLFRSQIFGYLLKLIWFPKIKLIFHEHGQIFEDGLFYKSFLRLTSPLVDLYLAVSEATSKLLSIRAGVKDHKIKILSNFIDFQKFSNRISQDERNKRRMDMGYDSKDYIIGFAGRLSPVKGCEFLVRALALIKRPEVKVVVAGDGPQRASLEALSCKLGLDKRIQFLGRVEDMAHFFQTLDVLVVPSKTESFGLAAVEAQASGVPVIASDVEGLNEVVKHEINGLLFKNQDSLALANAVFALKEDDALRSRLTERASEDAAFYALEFYLNTLYKVYGEI